MSSIFYIKWQNISQGQISARLPEEFDEATIRTAGESGRRSGLSLWPAGFQPAGQQDAGAIFRL
jgi:hypothetical protein